MVMHPLVGLTVTVSTDSLLRRSTFALSGPAALSHTYGYDGASRLESVTDGSFSASYGYLADSPLVETVTMRQGTAVRMVTTKNHDLLDRLQGLRTRPQAAQKSRACHYSKWQDEDCAWLYYGFRCYEPDRRLGR